MASLLSDAWRQARGNILGLAVILLAVLAPLEILVHVVDRRRGADSWESWTVTGALTGALALLISLSVLRLAGRAWPAAVSTTLRRSPAILATTAIVCVGLVLGFLLLVVPGVLLAAWWLLSYETLLLEKRGVIAALRRSRELVRGRFAIAFGAFVLTVAAYLLPWALALVSDEAAVDVAAVTLADVVSTLVLAAVTVALYQALTERPAVEGLV